MLSGRAPEKAIGRLRKDRLQSLTAVAPARVSGELSAAVDATLAVDRRDRPQSLDEVAGHGWESRGLGEKRCDGKQVARLRTIRMPWQDSRKSKS